MENVEECLNAITLGILIVLFAYCIYVCKDWKKHIINLYGLGFIACSLFQEINLMQSTYNLPVLGSILLYGQFSFAIIYINGLYHDNMPNVKFITAVCLVSSLLIFYDALSAGFVKSDNLRGYIDLSIYCSWLICMFYMIFANINKIAESKYLLSGLIFLFVAKISDNILNISGIFSLGYLLLFLSIVCMVSKRVKNAFKQAEFLNQNLMDEVERQTVEILNQQKGLEYSNQNLVEADRYKTVFFQNISRELSTPLARIQGTVDSIISRFGVMQSDAWDNLHTIKRNSENLLDLINQFLDISRIDLNEMQIQLEKIDIVSVCMSISGSFNELAKENSVNYTIEFPKNSVFIVTDRKKIECILNNLLSNAFKFTANGGKIHVELELPIIETPASETVQEVVKIRIKDTGIGISEQSLPHIFDRFWQVDGSTIRKFGGTGIGLALVKEYLTLLQGDIKVLSELGKGSEFTVSLPIEIGKNIETRMFYNSRQHQMYLNSIKDITKNSDDCFMVNSVKNIKFNRLIDCIYDSKKKIVFILDDNKELLIFLKTNLISRYNVFAATDGMQGLEKIKTLPKIPDIIISDIMMPVMDGMDFYQKLTSDQKLLHIPFIFLTAKTDDRLKGLALGAVDYICKPIFIDELVNKINSLLELQDHHNKKITERMKEKISIIFKKDQDTSDGEAIFDERCLHYSVTAREKQIISLILKGYSDKMVSDELFIAKNTVNQHIKNIYKKFSVNSRMKLIQTFSPDR